LEGCRNAAEKRFDFFETWHENFAEKLAKWELKPERLGDYFESIWSSMITVLIQWYK
jgi:hypothetical protein